MYKTNRSLFLGALLATTFLIGTGVQAQVPDARFTTAAPERAEERFRRKEIMPDQIPSVEIQRAPLAATPAGAQNVRFTLKSVEVAGATIYAPNELTRFYQDKVGTTVSLADIYALANTLTRKYRDDGYLLSQVTVPPQTIASGIVRLKAVEGFVDKISVEGTANVTADELELIRGYANRINAKKGPVNAAQLERGMLLINDLPGVKARGILSPSRTTGASDLQIIADRDFFDGQASVDNFGTRYLGATQIGGAAAFNSMAFGNNEKITLQAVVAPRTFGALELAYVGASYFQPLLANGLTLELTMNRTMTKPGYTLQRFDVRGISQFAAATLNYPVIRTRTTNLSGHATFDQRDVTSKTNVDPKRADHIRALRLGGRFETLDMLMGPAFNSVDLEIAKGLDIFGASARGDTRLSRPDGLPGFAKLNAEIQRLQSVIDRVNLLLAIKGQMTSSALLSSEQFGVGGNVYGRGYDSSEITGDRGFSTKAELQWSAPYKVNLLENYQLYAFWDAGHVRNLKPTTAADSLITLSSAGAGLRGSLNADTSLGFFAAAPLTKDVSTQGNKQPSVYFNVNRRF